jgi:hypothetical protein
MLWSHTIFIFMSECGNTDRLVMRQTITRVEVSMEGFFGKVRFQVSGFGFQKIRN